MTPLYLLYDLGDPGWARACSALAAELPAERSAHIASLDAARSRDAGGALDPATVDQLLFVWGPGVCRELEREVPHRPIREVVVVPDPVERNAVPDAPIDTIVTTLADRVRVPRTRRTIDGVLDVLTSVWLVARAEHLDETVVLLRDALGVAAIDSAHHDVEATGPPRAVDGGPADIDHVDIVLHAAIGRLEERALDRLQRVAPAPERTANQ